MPNNLKIILDVNIWVSTFISLKMEQQIKTLILQNNIEIIACHELLTELEQTLQRPKFKKYLSPKRTQFAIELLKESATFIHLKSKVELCRDDKDDYLLALAKDARADFLLTGDNDLLVLKQFEKTQIIKLTDYLKLATVTNREAIKNSLFLPPVSIENWDKKMTDKSLGTFINPFTDFGFKKYLAAKKANLVNQSLCDLLPISNKIVLTKNKVKT